jgi:hypothetical protein
MQRNLKRAKGAKSEGDRLLFALRKKLPVLFGIGKSAQAAEIFNNSRTDFVGIKFWSRWFDPRPTTVIDG